MKKRRYKKKKRNARQKRRRLNFKAFFGSASACAILAAVAFAPKIWAEVSRYVPISVQHLEVLGTSGEISTEIQELLPVEPGEPLFGPWIRGAVAKIREHPRIQEAQISRQLNGKVIFHVKEKEAEALLSLGRLYEFDENGKILGPLQRRGLAQMDHVVVTGPWRSMAELKAHPGALDEALEVKRALEFAGFAEGDISEIHMDLNKGWEVYFIGKSLRFVLGKNKFEERARRLKKILEDMDQHLAKIWEVDLGFEDRAIVKVYEQFSL